MAGDEEPVAAGENNSTTSEEVKPYKIHVSSRYLNLTKQKLEIARLPHELDEPKSRDWWQPKSQVEPLIDFWLEQYQWRAQEEILNRLPQFRTAFTVPHSESPIRIHFIHARSQRANVIPLLLIPPFPFSNLSLGHLVELFTNPKEANHQPFHLVIPSLPGLGFSDTLPTNSPVISTTAKLLDSLMKRLGYSHYIATNAGAGACSPAQIDYKLINRLATEYPDSCLGTHLISPPLAQPRLQDAPLGWAKWSIASTFKASIWGYRSEDLSALRQNGSSSAPPKRSPPAAVPNGANRLPRGLGLGLGLTEPNTLSYALCDSPTGLLVFVLGALRLLAPRKEFEPEQIINFTQLAWLPGPEAAMRFWAYCSRHPESDGSSSSSSSESSGNKAKKKKKLKGAGKPRVALTVFLGDEQKEKKTAAQGAGAGVGAGNESAGVSGSNGNGNRNSNGTRNSSSGNANNEETTTTTKFSGPRSPYSCPSWAQTHYTVVHTNRATGKPGLLAWERPEIIASGVRGLAAAILRVDVRLKPAETVPPAEPVPVPTVNGTTANGTATTTTRAVNGQPQQQPQQQAPITTEPPPAPQLSSLLAPPKVGERLSPVREVSDDTKVASDESLLNAKTASPSPLLSPSPLTAAPSPVDVEAK